MIEEHNRIAEELKRILDDVTGITPTQEARARLAAIRREALLPETAINSHERDIMMKACDAVGACFGLATARGEKKRQIARENINKISYLASFRDMGKRLGRD